MASWRLDSSLTAESIENIAVEIASSADPLVEFVLHDIRRGGLSSTARMLGLLARLREDGRSIRLLIHTGDVAKGVREDSKYWAFFSDELLGITLLLYADSVVKQNGEQVKDAFVTRSNEVMTATFAQVRHGNRLGFFAHDEPFTPPPAHIYEFVKGGSRSEFRRGLLYELNSTFNLAGSETGAETGIANYLWEIIKNTQDHGQVLGGAPTFGMRITEMKRYNLDQFRHNSVLAGTGDQELTSYLNHVREKAANASILEITVADSGPGIAATMLGENDIQTRSPEEELTATRDAFTRRGTSQSRSDPDAGLGLVLALRACRELDAFVSIRTGRTYMTKHYLADSNGENLHLRADRKLPLLAGTSITVLIPWSASGPSLSASSRP